MGSLTSRQEGATEEPDPDHVHSYRYPPKSGNYFGTHFIMGGEKFETPQPEAYLFGENSDLNFLSGRPAPCPYALSAPSEPSKTLKSVINVRKDSLRLVRHQPEGGAAKDTANQRFNIEFTFDSDVRCTITIHYFCTEEVTRTGLSYRPRDPSMSSATYRYKCGAAQTFSQSDHVLEPALYSEADLTYNVDVDVYPVVVLCRSEEGDEPRQCHVITAYVDRLSDGSYVLKPLKQKQFLDGLMFLLQEIYGIENKLVDKSTDDEMEDSGAECVICMSDLRDTLILPCRHLCVCNCCADHLRYQANNCPICRAPFRALLQLRAVQRSLPGSQPPTEGMEGVPAGYEPVALVEALNGPLATPRDSASDRSPVPSRAASAPPRPPTSNKRDDHSGGSDRSGSRDSLPAVSSAVVPLEVRRRVLAERGRAELEAGEAGVGTRSRTPSREKSTREDGGADDTDECERRSLLESPPPPTPAPTDPLSPALGPASPTPSLATCGRLPCDAGGGDCDDSAEHNSQLVTVIPIEHDSHVQLEEYEDTEDEVIEAQCRPDTERTPQSLKFVSTRSSNRKVTSGRPQAAEVVVLTSESPSATSRASLSSSGSTRLLISGVSRETEM